MSSFREGVAAELRAEMARQRKSGVELASVLNLSQQSVSRRLNGDTDISLDEIAVIADWLQVPVQKLLPSTPAGAA